MVPTWNRRLDRSNPIREVPRQPDETDLTWDRRQGLLKAVRDEVTDQIDDAVPVWDPRPDHSNPVRDVQRQ